MMQNKSFGKNLFLVAFSRGASLISSVFAGFLIPKFFSVSDYGFYKVFTLYAVYTALLHFGFVDGILLKLSGKSYNELDFSEMRTYTRFFIAFETCISLLMMAICLIFLHGDYLFIAAMLAVNMVFVNATTYYQFISQAVQRFGEYSAKSLIASVAKFLFVSGLFVAFYFGKAGISYRVYLIGLNIIDFSMLAWYVFIYREITFGKAVPVRSIKKDISDIFKTGIILTMAYQVSHLVLALDRQFVNALFSTETFAVYSFAYNIVTMISTMISSASVVLLPMLKKAEPATLTKFYKKSISTVSVIAAFSLFAYFPLSPFIEWFLPNYTDSIRYISIVLPAFLFTAVITIVMFTLAKVLDMSWDFFKESCIVLLLGFITNAIAYIVFKSPQSISYASLSVMIIWFVISGSKLKSKTSVGVQHELFYLITVSAGFLAVTGIIKGYIRGFFIFAVWLVLWTAVFYHQEIKKVLSAVKRKITEK